VRAALSVLTISFGTLAAMVAVRQRLYFDAKTGQPICPPDFGDDYSLKHFRLPTPAIQHINLAWLKRMYGHAWIYAAQSSLTREDTTDAHWGGLPEKRRLFSRWLDDLAASRPILHNYLKVLDRPTSDQLDEIGLSMLLPLGRSIERELRRSLNENIFPPIAAPENAGWSLWIGANGSTTSLHVDDHRFNVLVVLQGAKRFVLVRPEDHQFACERPPRNPNACWAGVDVLTGAPPSYAHEVIVRPGEGILLSEMIWHAVQNLGPTVAVGLNEHPECTGSRFAALRPHWDERDQQRTLGPPREVGDGSWFGNGRGRADTGGGSSARDEQEERGGQTKGDTADEGNGEEDEGDEG